MERMASMIKVVVVGSFSAAAREMQVSQALVTKQIQDLESWLGARLINRTTLALESHRGRDRVLRAHRAKS